VDPKINDKKKKKTNKERRKKLENRKEKREKRKEKREKRNTAGLSLTDTSKTNKVSRPTIPVARSQVRRGIFRVFHCCQSFRCCSLFPV